MSVNENEMNLSKIHEIQKLYLTETLNTLRSIQRLSLCGLGFAQKTVNENEKNSAKICRLNCTG